MQLRIVFQTYQVTAIDGDYGLNYEIGYLKEWEDDEDGKSESFDSILLSDSSGHLLFVILTKCHIPELISESTCCVFR